MPETAARQVVVCEEPMKALLGPRLGGMCEAGAVFVLMQHDEIPADTVLSLPIMTTAEALLGPGWGRSAIRRLRDRFGDAITTMDERGGYYRIDGKKLPRTLLAHWLRVLCEMKPLEVSVLGVGNSEPTKAMETARRRWCSAQFVSFFPDRHKLLDADPATLLRTTACVVHDGDGQRTVRVALTECRELRGTMQFDRLPALMRAAFPEMGVWAMTPTSMVAHTDRVHVYGEMFARWMRDVLALHFLQTLQLEQEERDAGV